MWKLINLLKAVENYLLNKSIKKHVKLNGLDLHDLCMARRISHSKACMNNHTIYVLDPWVYGNSYLLKQRMKRAIRNKNSE